METLPLRKKVKINGVETDKIEYDFDKLEPKDLQFAEREFAKAGNMSVKPSLSETYQAIVFAQSAGLCIADLNSLDPRDYQKAAGLVFSYFFADTEE